MNEIFKLAEAFATLFAIGFFVSAGVITSFQVINWLIDKIEG